MLVVCQHRLAGCSTKHSQLFPSMHGSGKKYSPLEYCFVFSIDHPYIASTVLLL